jgi:hypothetical protein
MTGGAVENKDLITDQTTVNISAGEVQVYATVLKDAKVKQEEQCIVYGGNKLIKKRQFRRYN